jgi:endonuclease G
MGLALLATPYWFRPPFQKSCRVLVGSLLVAGSQAQVTVRRAATALLGWWLAVLAPACGTPPLLVPAGPRARPASASVHLALGEPQDADPSDDVVVDHGVFVLSYNPGRRVANWVAWRLVAEDLGPAGRSNRFHPDSQLPMDMPGPRPVDYANSPYERGHLCPSRDRTASAQANDETFVMTNMQPQRHALNAGPWRVLESYERGLAGSGKQLFIVAGGLFDAAPEVLPAGEAIPRANFKIIVVLARGQGAAEVTSATTTYAVIMPNRADVASVSWWAYQVPIDQIERESGYDFLSQVSLATQAVLEAKK